MLDKSAIQEIQSSAVGLHANDAMVEQCVPAIIAPKDYTLLSLESYQTNRSRFRGAFNTSSLDDFSEYAKQHQEPAVFIDETDYRAVAIFDLGTIDAPGHAQHRASLKPRKTAAFLALQRFSENKLSQNEIVVFLEDWRDHIAVYGPDDQIIPLPAAIAVFRDITIAKKMEQSHQVSDTRAARSAMEEIEAKSRDVIPVALTFNCTPFDGFQQRLFRLRVLISTSGEKPTITLNWSRKEADLMALAEEFKELVKTSLDGHPARIYMGEFSPG